MNTIEARPRDLVALLRRARVDGKPIALRAPPGSDVSVVRVLAGRDSIVNPGVLGLGAPSTTEAP